MLTNPETIALIFFFSKHMHTCTWHCVDTIEKIWLEILKKIGQLLYFYGI